MVSFRALSFGFAVFGVSLSARSEPAMHVLLAGACTPAGVSAEEILRILDAELAPGSAAPLRNPEDARRADAVVGVDGCTDVPVAARISVYRHGEHRERVVALDDTEPEGRNRVLALALAEAIRNPTTTERSERPAAPWESPAPAPMMPRPAPPVRDETAPASHSRERRRGLAPYASGLLRYVPASSTFAFGVGGGVAWNRESAGLTVLGAHRTDVLGAATLVAVSATASFDPVDLSGDLSLRISGELGAAFATGSPTPAAVGYTSAAVHAAMLGGVVAAFALGPSAELEGFVGGGYASSLDADADGRRVAGLSGGLLAASIAVRFP